MPDQTIVEQHDDHVDVIESPTVVEVIEQTEYVEVYGVGIQGSKGDPGPEGPQGPQGEQGEQGPSDVSFRFVFNQMVPSAEWVIDHSLGGQPNVTVVDSTGRVVVGDLEYLNTQIVIARFAAAFSGQAYLS